jgi:hypothetical protein
MTRAVSESVVVSVGVGLEDPTEPKSNSFRVVLVGLEGSDESLEFVLVSPALVFGAGKPRCIPGSINPSGIRMLSPLPAFLCFR